MNNYDLNKKKLDQACLKLQACIKLGMVDVAYIQQQNEKKWEELAMRKRSQKRRSF